MLALSIPALLFSTGCALLYAAADALRKSAPPGSAPEVILFYFVGGHIPVLGAWVLWTGETEVASGYLLPGLADGFLGLAANLLFIIAIRRSPLSLMVPLLALVPVFTLLFGGLTLGEWPGAHQIAGILLVAVGLFTLFQPPGATPGLRAAWAALRRERGTVPMMGVVLFWSLTPALDKLCLAQTSVGMHGLIQVTFMWIVLAAWLARRGTKAFRLPTMTLKPVGGAAFAGALAYACQLAAYSLAMVALVEVLKRTIGLLAALFLGRAAFSEPLTPTKVAGVIVIVAGLPLVMIA